jgi:hypothetical protein
MFYVLLLCYFDLRLNDIIDYSDDLQIVEASDDLQIVEAFDARFRCEVLAQNKCLLVEISPIASISHLIHNDPTGMAAEISHTTLHHGSAADSSRDETPLSSSSCGNAKTAGSFEGCR